MAKHKKRNRTTIHRQPVRAKKHLGQHFLTDEDIAHRIANTLSFNGYRNVVEIGPGTGVLTKHLLQHPINLVAMDLDRESIHYLQTSFMDLHGQKATQTDFKILEADFLQYDLSGLFHGEPYAITGNFPYNISTQIVFKLLDVRANVPEFSGMFQKEVAARICAKEGNKTYGILSVLAQAFYEAEYLFTVPPNVFDPPPKVHSGVLRLTRKQATDPICEKPLFSQVVKTAFNQRRKTLRNSLKTFDLSHNLREDAIFDRRPEQLSVTDFIALTKKIANDTV